MATVLTSAVADMERQATRIESQCPAALAAAPAGAGADALSAELLISLEVASLEPMREPLSGFAGAMVDDHLQWGDHELQRLVYAYVHEQRELLSLRPPDFCADAQSWAAGHDSTLPAATQRLLGQAHHLSAARDAETDRQLQNALRRHTTTSERGLLQRVASIEADQASTIDTRLQYEDASVARSLGLPASNAHENVLPPYASPAR